MFVLCVFAALRENTSRKAAKTQRRKVQTVSYFSNGVYLNFWPPTEASYIRPPFCCVKINMPPVYFALPDAPDFAATAETCAENSTLFSLKRSSVVLSWKNITSL